MNVSLTPQLEELVHKKVASGLYGSASEVVRQALRLLATLDEQQEAKLRNLRAAIQEGVASGEPTPLDLKALRADIRSPRKTRRQ